jgi:hypothetical protein
MPRFDRWTYWEKFDFLAVFWAMLTIGLTGLMLRIVPVLGLNNKEPSAATKSDLFRAVLQHRKTLE